MVVHCKRKTIDFNYSAKISTMKVQFKVSFNFTEIADGDITKLETLS